MSGGLPRRSALPLRRVEERRPEHGSSAAGRYSTAPNATDQYSFDPDAIDPLATGPRADAFRDDGAAPLSRASWPGTLAPVRDLLAGFDLDPVTILVGENGAGKSTLVEAIAQAWGFPVEGGDLHQQRDPGEGSSVLAPHLTLHRGTVRARNGFFLRAETMHALAVHIDTNRLSGRGRRWLTRSHGESFMAMLEDADRTPGLWILDEPESALSFQGQLGLLALLQRRAAEGSQVLLSTHSPVLAAIPGAALWEVSEAGLTRSAWEDLDVVAHWRGFLDDPRRYLRHLAPDP